MILVKDDVGDLREVYTRAEVEELLAEATNPTQARVAELERRLDALAMSLTAVGLIADAAAVHVAEMEQRLTPRLAEMEKSLATWPVMVADEIADVRMLLAKLQARLAPGEERKA